MVGIKITDILNPSNDASTTSPGRKLKNFFPAFEFASELVKYPETFTTPVRTPFATLSVIWVILLTLYKHQCKRQHQLLFEGSGSNRVADQENEQKTMQPKSRRLKTLSNKH